MKRVICTVIVLMILASCRQANLLTYKRKQYYSESSVISRDSVLTLYQNVCFNIPNMMDEEFCHTLKLSFTDTLAAKTKKVLDLEKDTALVKAQYSRFSVWNWDSENNQLKGRVEILTWDSSGILLKEKVMVYDYRRKTTRRFTGTRLFTRPARHAVAEEYTNDKD